MLSILNHRLWGVEASSDCARSPWSPKSMHIIDMSTAMSGTLLPQTHGNWQSLLWVRLRELSKSFSGFPPCDLLQVPPPQGGCNLTQFPYRDHPPRLADPSSHPEHNKNSECPGCCCPWCWSDGLSTVQLSCMCVYMSVLPSFPHHPSQVSMTKLYKRQQLVKCKSKLHPI